MCLSDPETLDIDSTDYIMWRLNATADFFLTWFVAFFTLFVGLIALLPELRNYGNVVLTMLIAFIYEAMVVGAIFSIRRLIQLIMYRMKLEQKLGRQIRDDIWGTRPFVYHIFFRYDKNGDVLGMRRKRLIALYLSYGTFWSIILYLKLFL